MIGDLGAVLWKEYREILNIRRSRRGTFMAVAFVVVLIGIFFPLQYGHGWTDSPISLMTWFMTSFIFASATIADAIAGERERHTLETLLSTRLPEQAILLGKITAAVSYAFGIAFLTNLMSVVAVTVVYGGGRILMFPPGIMLSGIATGFLTASIVANAGTLVSLRAATVRQAQQTMSIAAMIVFFSPMIILRVVPQEYFKSVQSYLAGTDTLSIAVTVFLVFLAADIVLFRIALGRFKRSRLIVGQR